MTPTEKQKCIAEQSVYGDLKGVEQVDCTEITYRASDVEYIDIPNIVKPILRPLSDLTKEITHRGYNNDEPFIPLYKLTEAFTYHKWSDDRFRLEINKDYIVIGIYSKSLNAWGIHATIDLTLSKLDLLNMLHFDTRNLIEAGGAISTDTINPYEV